MTEQVEVDIGIDLGIDFHGRATVRAGGREHAHHLAAAVLGLVQFDSTRQRRAVVADANHAFVEAGVVDDQDLGNIIRRHTVAIECMVLPAVVRAGLEGLHVLDVARLRPVAEQHRT